MAWNWSLVLMFQCIKDVCERSTIPDDAVRDLQHRESLE
jgi:hypothetical protein